MAIRRLRKELDQVSTFGVTGIKSIGPKGDNILQWSAKLSGPRNTPYEGGVFSLDIEFPDSYPFRAPRVKFRTCVYHPSISKATGQMCSGIIEDEWKPNKNVAWVLKTVSEVLTTPSSSSPLEVEIARQLERYPNEFKRTAKEWTKMYAD